MKRQYVGRTLKRSVAMAAALAVGSASGLPAQDVGANAQSRTQVQTESRAEQRTNDGTSAAQDQAGQARTQAQGELQNRQGQQGQQGQQGRLQSQQQGQQQGQQDQQGRLQAQQEQQGQQPQVGMGVRLAPSETTGVRVTAVQPNGPAMRAGIRENDYILAIDGQKVENEQQFSQLLSQRRPNERVPVTIWRNNARQELEVGLTALGQAQAQSDQQFQGQQQGQQFGQQQAQQGQQFGQQQFDQQRQYGQQQQFGQPQQFGQTQQYGQPQQYGQQQFGQPQQFGQMQGQTQGQQGFAARPQFEEPGAWIGVWLDDQAARGQAQQEQQRGVEIQRMYPGGPAAISGLREGDRIIAIGGEQVSGAEAVSELVSSRNPNEEVQFTVLRGGQEVQIPVRLGSRPMFAYSEEQMQGGQSMSAFDTIPEHDMMMEHNRRMAEQHQRLEEQLTQLREEIRQLREELTGRGTQGAARPQFDRGEGREAEDRARAPRPEADETTDETSIETRQQVRQGQGQQGQSPQGQSPQGQAGQNQTDREQASPPRPGTND